MDSRLRGNDGLVRGNDGLVRGNDKWVLLASKVAIDADLDAVGGRIMKLLAEVHS